MSPISPKTASSCTQADGEAHKKLFLTYFQTFYSHRERILSDSRMFLAHIPMQNYLAYNGTHDYECPTLGILIEWLLNTPYATEQDDKGCIWMLCRLNGIPIRRLNTCTWVDVDGKTHSEQVSHFSSLCSTFMSISERYNDAKTKYQHYTLKEVVAIFAEEGLLQPDQNEITILHLTNQVARLKQQIKEADRRDRKRTADFHQALMKRHFDQLYPMVLELEQKLSDSEQRLQQIYAFRVDLRNRLRNKEISPRDYQQQLAPLNREREEILRFCRKRSTIYAMPYSMAKASRSMKCKTFSPIFP